MLVSTIYKVVVHYKCLFYSTQDEQSRVIKSFSTTYKQPPKLRQVRLETIPTFSRTAGHRPDENSALVVADVDALVVLGDGQRGHGRRVDVVRPLEGRVHRQLRPEHQLLGPVVKVDKKTFRDLTRKRRQLSKQLKSSQASNSSSSCNEFSIVNRDWFLMV